MKRHLSKISYIVIGILFITTLIMSCTPEINSGISPSDNIVASSSSSDVAAAYIRVHTDNPGRTIPSDFLGLSYDAPLLASSHFDFNNKQFINLLNTLGKGVLCFGANGVEYTYWLQKPRRFLFFGRADTSISHSDLERMFTFARTIRWRVIFGLNLRANDPKMASDEALYATKIGSDSIIAFQIGNEPDLYSRNGLRPSSYTYENYHEEFKTYLRALRDRVPNIPVAGPVSATNIDWFTKFLKDEAPNLAFATNHYYPLNANLNVDQNDPMYASIENLLSAATAKRAADTMDRFLRTSSMYGVPLRFDEINSSYPGKDGVGNTFASALWIADYLFTLAEHGVAGANIFGGMVCRGYTPICMNTGFFNLIKQYHAQPLYYGMLLFHIAANGRVVPVELDTAGNITTHATLGEDSKLWVTIINKDTKQTVNANISIDQPFSNANAWRLTAPSLQAKDGVTFAGNSVSAEGTWSPKTVESVPQIGSNYQIIVPAGSAVVVIFD